MNSVTSALIDLLDQSRHLLTLLDDAGYTRPEPMAMNATVVGHLRAMYWNTSSPFSIPRRMACWTMTPRPKRTRQLSRLA